MPRRHHSLLVLVTAGLMVALNGRSETAAPAPAGVTLGVEAGIGRGSYQEDVSIRPAQSDWDAAFGAIGLSARVQDTSAIQMRGRLNLWSSDRQTEKWRENDALVQENALAVWGAELAGDLGFDVHPAGRLRLRPFLGAGFRFQRFERSRFRFFSDQLSGDDSSVQEDFDLSYLRAGGAAEILVSPAFKVFGEASLAGVVQYQADNSALGQVQGDGGKIVNLETGLAWSLKGGQEIAVAIRYDLQDLNGGKENARLLDSSGQRVPGFVELPDNKLEALSGEVRWRIPL